MTPMSLSAILFTITSLLLASKVSFYAAPVNCDVETKPYLDDFLALAADHGFTFSEEDVEIGLGEVEQLPGDPGETTVGICYKYPDQLPRIVIASDTWEKSDDADREALLFHELGHCLLGRDHVEDKIQLNNVDVRVSVMSHFVPLGKEYKIFKTYYREELFNLEEIPVDVVLTRYRPSEAEACNYLDSCGE
jgi:hypothetical protein